MRDVVGSIEREEQRAVQQMGMVSRIDGGRSGNVREGKGSIRRNGRGRRGRGQASDPK